MFDSGSIDPPCQFGPPVEPGLEFECSRRRFEKPRAVTGQPSRVFTPQVTQDARRIADTCQAGWNFEPRPGAAREQDAEHADVRHFFIRHTQPIEAPAGFLRIVRKRDRVQAQQPLRLAQRAQ